ncbi:hypothetical protein RND81_04G050500 [Saponaria officinalis]|uniref:Ubiquitin-like protease family profile domain-containing protein n=1 Tax=Saponaria officinalis TaxID=3572 RepID=A0AAW1LH89_SAPOF
MSVKFAFGDQMGNNKRTRKRRASLEDREALKNEIREELINEMKEQVRSSVSSILHEIGLPAVDKLTFDRLSDGGGGTETCLVKAQEQPGPSLQQKFKNDTPCLLLLKDPHSGVIYEVAHGKTFPGEVCHQDSVGPGEIRVKVSIVPQEFESLPLPVPVSAYDLYLLRDVVGSFIPWPIALLRLDDEGELKDKEVGIMGSNSHHSRFSATPKKAPTRDSIVESLSQDCQWLNSLVGTMGDGETYTVHFDANLLYYSKETKIEVYKDGLKQFIKGCELNISIIQICIRALQEDLFKMDIKPRIGWLCPDATSDAKLIKKPEVAIAYVAKAFQKSTDNGDEFILAPIIDRRHWLQLVICPQTYTIYEFDSITLRQGHRLYMKMIVLSALKRYKMSGGEIKVKRNEPLWKSMKCPQQNGSMEFGYFVMRFMYDIVKSCASANDLEKVRLLLCMHR